MTKEELNQLATVNDLHNFHQKIVSEIKQVVTENNIKELYTPREFEAATGMKYTTVLLYCNNGNRETLGRVGRVKKREVVRPISAYRSNSYKNTGLRKKIIFF